MIEPSQPRRFPAAVGSLGASVGLADPTAHVFDSASYQALLASLGLTPDPRLCVPAVQR